MIKGSSGDGSKVNDISTVMKGAQLRTSAKSNYNVHKTQQSLTSNGDHIVYESKGKLDIFTNEDYEKVEVRISWSDRIRLIYLNLPSLSLSLNINIFWCI